MAKVIGLAGVVVFITAVALYTRYVFRRFGPPLATPWPRGTRLALFWVGIVLAPVIVVPAVLVAVGYVLGMTNCPAQFSPGEAWGCSPIGRLTFLLGTLAIGLPLAALWLRFLLGRAGRESRP